MEHERQRALQRKLFEDQMKALEQQQAAELLSLPVDPNDVTSPNGIHNVALSAPTTPPRAPSVVNGIRYSPVASSVTRDPYTAHEQQTHAHALSSAMNKADKRKSVTYAPSPSVLHSPEVGLTVNSANTLGPMARPAGAKSMPASRRTSASAETLEVDDIAGSLQSLALADVISGSAQHAANRPQGILRTQSSRFSEEPGVIGETHSYGGDHAFNAGMMLDQQLDQEMHSTCRGLSCTSLQANQFLRRDEEPPDLGRRQVQGDNAHRFANVHISFHV